MKSLLALVMKVPQTLAGAVVFSAMWNWFLVRKFHDLPRLGVLDSVGILMVAGFPFFGLYVHQAREQLKKEMPTLNDDDVTILFAFTMTLVVYPLLLGISYVWHLIIGG